METLNKIEPTWDSYYSYLATLPQGNVAGMDGYEFERFCQAYYKMLGQYKNVWLSKEIPQEVRVKLNLWSKGDHGVDLVLEDFQGKLSAVQCKFHRDQQSSLDWNSDKLGNLFLEGEKADYRVIFTNVAGISEYTEKFDKWEFVGFETVATIETDVFGQILALLDEKVSEVVRTPKTPRKDQLEALNAILEGFKEGDKGQLLVPCGWGKSLEALWVYEGGKFDRALILVPSLSLLKQTKNVWNANRKDLSVPYLCICSEYDIDKEAEDGTKVYKKSEDDAEIRLHSVDSRVTTDSKVVKDFLKDNQKAIVYCTYQSFHVIEKLVKGKKALPFGLTVFDEAHKTVGQKDRSFTTPLNTKFQLGKRLFQTATPKVYRDGVKEKSEETVYDMNDEKIYGKPFYKMSFRQAIDLKLLAPYKIVITGLTDEDLQKLVKDRTYGQTKDGSLLNFETAANHIALSKTMEDFKSKHAITFHSTINNAKAFMKDHVAISGFNGQVVHVNGEQSASERLGTMNAFKSSQDAIMTNARCLTEGIDVPNIDLVMFCDPKKAKIDIVQAAGRAMRIDKNNPDKQAVILLPVYFKDVKTMDSEIDESVFKDVKAILNALQDVDEVLMAEINALKTGDGKRKVTPDSRGSSGAKEEKILEISTYIPSFKEKIITVVRESKYYNPEQKKKEIIEWVERHVKDGIYQFPSRQSKDIEEIRLASVFSGYISHTSSFDQNFVNILKERFSFKYLSEVVVDNKSNIIDWIKLNKKRPSRASHDELERTFATLLNNYTNPQHGTYDKEFESLVNKISTPLYKDIGNTKTAILDFCITHGYQPKQKSDNALERRLAGAIGNIGRKTRLSSENNFLVELKKYPTFMEFDRKQTQKEILDFVQKKGYRPSVTSKNSEERHLGHVWCSYLNNKASSFTNKEFMDSLKDVPGANEFKTLIKKRDIKEFVTKSGRIPLDRTTDLNEKILGQAWYNLKKKTNPNYDEIFVTEIENIVEKAKKENK